MGDQEKLRGVWRGPTSKRLVARPQEGPFYCFLVNAWKIIEKWNKDKVDASQPKVTAEKKEPKP